MNMGGFIVVFGVIEVEIYVVGLERGEGGSCGLIFLEVWSRVEICGIE